VEAFELGRRHAERLRSAASCLRGRVAARGRERGESVQGGDVVAGGRAIEPSINFMIRRQVLAKNGRQLCRRSAPTGGRRRIVAAIDRSDGLHGDRRDDGLVNCIFEEGVRVGIPRILE